MSMMILRPGGVMVCDDYSSGWPGVVSAINQFVAEKKLPMTSSIPSFFAAGHLEP